MLTVLNFGRETKVRGNPVITWGCHHGVKAAWLGRGSWSQHFGSLPGQCGSDGRESVCNAGDLGSILGLKDPLEKGMATYSSMLVWRIPWTEKPGRLQSMGL